MRSALLVVAGLLSLSAGAATFHPKTGGGFRVESVPTYSPVGVPYLRPTLIFAPNPSLGSLVLSDALRAPGPSGAVIDVVAKQVVPWSSVAKIVGRSLPLISTGMAVWEILDDLRAKGDGETWVYDDGKPEEMQDVYSLPGSAGCSDLRGTSALSVVAACNTRRYIAPNDTVISTACANAGCTAVDVVAQHWTQNTGTGAYYKDGLTVVQHAVSKVSALACATYKNNGVGADQPGERGLDGKCKTGTYRPSSPAEITDIWETNAPKEQAPTVAEELLKKGARVDPVPDTTLEGPTEIESPPRTTTRTKEDGTVETIVERDVTTIRYEGDSYYWDKRTITTDGGGTVTDAPAPDAGTPAVDRDLPPVPDLYTQKYPDGLAGVWAAEMSAIRETPIFAFLDSLVPSTGDGGCPVWSFSPGAVLGINVAGDLSVPCYVWSFVRLIMVITALLLARRLVFGG